MYREQLMEKKEEQNSRIISDVQDRDAGNVCDTHRPGKHDTDIRTAFAADSAVSMHSAYICIERSAEGLFIFYKDGQFSGLLPVCDTGVSDQRD